MTKNLETADTIVKLVMSTVVIVCYYADIFTGPFAHLLFFLAITVVALTVVRMIIANSRDQ